MKFTSFLLFLVFGATALADELLIGAATEDITPDHPVALAGQFGTRISSGSSSPLTLS